MDYRTTVQFQGATYEGGVDEDGAFRKIGSFEDGRIAEFFSSEVFGFILRRVLPSPEWAKSLLSWRYTDFNVQRRVRAKTKSEPSGVGNYMIRPLLELERLSLRSPKAKAAIVMARTNYLSRKSFRGILTSSFVF